MACVSRGFGVIVTLAVAAVLAPIQLACGDGSFYLEHMSWRNWNRAVAHGSGYAEANDCEPTCADGHVHRYRVAVNLDGRHRCPDGRLYYSHLVIHNVSRSRPPFP